MLNRMASIISLCFMIAGLVYLVIYFMNGRSGSEVITSLGLIAAGFFINIVFVNISRKNENQESEQ